MVRFLAFLRCSGRHSAVRRPLAFQEANESKVALLGRIQLVSVLIDGWSWGSGSAVVVFRGAAVGEWVIGAWVARGVLYIVVFLKRKLWRTSG